MRRLVLLALVGLGAALVDGSLGMAYGVTTSTLLLVIGTNPAAASATVHLAEIGTTLASGVSHWRFGNVDWRVVRGIAVPGAVGAFAGASVLSRLDTSVARPLMSIVLLGLGLYVFTRFTFSGPRRDRLGTHHSRGFLGGLGLFAGFIDATGGGGWGPVGTPALLAGGRLEPRKVIGSIDTSEFLVSIAASGGFLLGLGHAGIDLVWVAALLLGGLVAAPIAALLVRVVPARVLGSLVGGVIILTNTRNLLAADVVAVPDGARPWIYTGIVVAWAAAFAWSLRAHRHDLRRERLAAQAARTRAHAQAPGAGTPREHDTTDAARDVACADLA